MPKVLHLCHSYYPPFLDCARQYAALFKGSQYEVLTVFLTGKPDAEIAKGVQHGEVHFLGFKSKEVGGLKLSAIQKIRQLHQQHEFTFCIAHRVKPTYVALLATDIPVISVHHNYNDYSRWSRRILVNFYKNRLLMLGVSDSVRDDLRRDLKGWPADKIQTLYNRIDVEATQQSMLNKINARKALGIPHGHWVVGNVGRLHHDKDQKTLIAGFAQGLPKLPSNALLVIIGSGPLDPALKAQVVAFGLQEKVLFLGQVPDAKRYFKAFDVFALTSDREPFGMVLLEAMAAGVPVICSDCGGGAEVVRGSGCLFPFADTHALSEQLIASSHTGLTSSIPKVLQQTFSDEAATVRFWSIITQAEIAASKLT